MAGEMARIDLVHIGIIVEVGEEDGGLDNFVQRAAGGREDRRHVGEHGRGLSPDVAIADDAADASRGSWPATKTKPPARTACE